MHCKNRITDVFLADTMQQNEAGMPNSHKCFWPRHPPVTPLNSWSLNINMPQDKQRRCAAAVTPLAVNTIQSNMRHASVTPLDWPSTKTVAHAHIPAVPKHGRAHLDTAQKGRSEESWISAQELREPLCCPQFSHAPQPYDHLDKSIDVPVVTSQLAQRCIAA